MEFCCIVPPRAVLITVLLNHVPLKQPNSDVADDLFAAERKRVSRN